MSRHVPVSIGVCGIRIAEVEDSPILFWPGVVVGHCVAMLPVALLSGGENCKVSEGRDG